MKSEHFPTIFDSIILPMPHLIDLSLGRIECLLSRLGHPEKRLPPIIHIAGTNGKGSVVAYCRAILECAGKSVHTYISPHLVHIEERIVLGSPSGGSCVTKAEFYDALEECKQCNGDTPISFFEIITAAAFLLYSRHPADYLLVEVGLGGRLDATNVITHPTVTVITSISYDHTAILGNDLATIALEKAGILKSGVPCSVSVQHDAALRVICSRAAHISAPLSISGEDWNVFEQHGRLVYQNEDELLDLPLPCLRGQYQINNAGTAITAINLLGDSSIIPDHIAHGLRTVDWPARFQRLSLDSLCCHIPSDTELWLDGGHNPAAGSALACEMALLEDKVSRPLVLVIGMMSSKDIVGFLSPFVGLTHRIISVKIPGKEHSLSADKIACIASSLGLSVQSAATIGDALEDAGTVLPSPRILICGSLYLAGHILEHHV